MKILQILFFIFFATLNACKSQKQITSTTLADLNFSFSTKLLMNQRYFEKQGDKMITDKLEAVSVVFNEINIGSTSNKPSDEFLAALQGYNKVISSLQSTPQPVALQLLNEIQSDMETKLQRNNSMKLDDKLTKPVRVKVVTRRIVDGREVDVPGYRINFKLWFQRDESRPIFNFSNPTLQAEKSITPGNYDIWAEIPGSNQQYPQKQVRVRTRIPDVDGEDTMIVILLLN